VPSTHIASKAGYVKGGTVNPLHLLTGSVSGAIARTVTNPLERLKILKQVDVGVYGKMNSFQSLAHMAKSEGMAGMMKGNGVNLVRIVPFSGLEFFFYEFYKQNLVGGYLNHNLEKLVCGGLTGMTASTITYPLDLIRTKLSIDTQAGKS
jgi:solute carrier family 25 phosphate transporter 23/24/25/41